MDPLTEQEIAQLTAIAAGAQSPRKQRRARLMLLAGQQKHPGEIAREIGLSKRRVFYWIREFRRRRMGVFASAAQALPETAAPAVSETSGAPKDLLPGAPPFSTRAAQLEPSTPLDQAVRAILVFHLEEIQSLAARLLQDPCPEGVTAFRWHVRAARRRLTSMEEQLDVTDLAPIPRQLRWLSKASRPLQSWQTVVWHTAQYLQKCEGDAASVELLLQDWQSEQRKAQDELLRCLGGRQYRQFVRAAGDLAGKRGAGIFGKTVARPLIRYVLAGLIWGQYQQLRLLEGGLAAANAKTLRQLRRQIRDLCYLLVGFQAVLGAAAVYCIQGAFAVEESLRQVDGLEAVLERAGADPAAKEQPEPPSAAVAAFLEAMEQERARRLARLPETLEPLLSPQFRRNLGLAVAEL